MRLPVVRLLDGASGGGSVKMTYEAGYAYLPVNPGWDAVVDNLSLVPVVAAARGPTEGLGAARLVRSHFAVMVTGVGQLFTAGPPVVRGSTGEDLTKEELGGAAVHRRNGTIERFAASEDAAFAMIRSFLSYLPGSVHELPPGGGCTVTALARLDGHPVGVLATDPYKGVTMSVEGAQAITRLVDLCETFHLPIVSLTDPQAEIERIRHALAAVSSPFRTAERFGVQDLIDPRDSRPLLCAWVRDAYRVLPGLSGRPSFGTRP